MRDVIVWSLRLVVLFVVLLGVSFVVLTIITPSPEELEDLVEAANAPESIAQADSSVAADSLTISPVDSLQALVDSLQSEIFFSQIRLDSMSQQLQLKSSEVENYLAQYEGLNQRIEELSNRKIAVKELSKTYETMKVNDIRPIVEKLDDATIIALYANMGSRTKKNLIQALSSVRAAEITKKIAGARP